MRGGHACQGRRSERRRRIRARRLAPDERVVKDGKAGRPRRPQVVSSLELAAAGPAASGTWTVEASIDGDVIDAQKLAVH